MEIDRRKFLGGAASLGLVGMTGPAGVGFLRRAHPAEPESQWHPLTQSLLDRACRAVQTLDRARVERVVQALVGEHGRPVIKWMESAQGAFEHLRRYPLSELVQMPAACFWPAPPQLPVQDYDAVEHSLDLNVLAEWTLSVEEHCGQLLEERLAFRDQITARDPAEAFRARVFAAEIGWIETSLTAVAARAIRAVDDLLAAGHAEQSEQIYHLLLVIEAYEHGLLATWETPDELVCLPVQTSREVCFPQCRDQRLDVLPAIRQLASGESKGST